MVEQSQVTLVGEIHCMSCSRILAEAVQSPISQKLRLRPAAHQQAVLLTRAGGNSLRCLRCHGCVSLEPVVQEGLRIASTGRDSLQRVA